jgi:serine-type D-Ala-D-Ala carboxypeptidase
VVRKEERQGTSVQQKSSGGMTTKRLIAMIALAVLAVAVIVFAVREIRLYGDVQVEQSRTPTPVPEYGNVMQVTIDPSLPTPVPVLRSGAQGEAVWQLQERLQALGYLTGSVDGQFGPATKEAVQLFQRQHGLTADGIVGEDTRELLYSDSAQPYATPTPVPTQAAQVTEAPAADDMILLTAEVENTIPVGFTADGLPLLVNRDSPLPDDYQPQQLVNMRDYCDSSIVSIKGSEIEGEQIAVDALLAMLTQAQSEGLTSWQISAGYRSVAYQQKLFDDKVYSYRQQGMTGAQARSAARKLVADPGCSEHHTGLAFDITVPGTSFGGTKQAKWLEEHCWEWGFILRYPADKTAITGITNEPWHFRYVGVDAAMEMHETGECLEEYVERKQKEQQ